MPERNVGVVVQFGNYDRGNRAVLMVFGIGTLGGPVVDILAMRYPQHRYVVVARTPDRSLKRANLVRYICSQWGQYPEIVEETTNLMDVDRTAELIARYRPDVVFNATTPFAWWRIDDLPKSLASMAHKAGPGVWCALDCILPLQLTVALALSDTKAVYVNGCYPDMVNAFLKDMPGAPRLGIGNLSNLIPGLTLAFATLLDCNAADISIKLVCHHYTSLNAPTIGGSGGAPYHLAVSHPGGRLTFDGPDNAPFALLKMNAPRVRGLAGQSVTVGSAATVLATLLNREHRRHHVPGPLGLIGGYPVLIRADRSVDVDLPLKVDIIHAETINAQAQLFDGVDEIVSNKVVATSAAKHVFKQIVGIDLPSVTPSNVDSLSRETIRRLNRRFALELTLA